MSRFLYQHKQAHRSSQTKEKEYPENLESSFKADIDLQNTVSECKREYFIWWTMQFLFTLTPLNFLPPFLSSPYSSFPSPPLLFFKHSFFFLIYFLFGKDHPAKETLTTITVPHSQHNNLAITVYSCSSRDPLSHSEQSKIHTCTWFLLWLPGCSEVPTSTFVFVVLVFFSPLLEQLIHHIYNRAGLCKQLST